jgi:hypothetical protein
VVFSLEYSRKKPDGDKVVDTSSMLPIDKIAVQEKNEVISDHNMLRSMTGQSSPGSDPTLLSVSKFQYVMLMLFLVTATVRYSDILL